MEGKKLKVIGISANLREDVYSSFEKYDISVVADNYIKSVSNSQAVPLVLPVIEEDEIIKEQLKCLDGIIMSGGEDVYPLFYNEEMLEKCGEPLVHRDIYDMKIVKMAIELNIPIMGICRGAQIINVALGGSLYQDLSYMDNVELSHANRVHQRVKSHKANIKKNSNLYSIYGDEVWINSFHHQAVKKLGEGLEVSAESTDGVVEAFEGYVNGTYILGVQWHPEMMASVGDEEMLKLFKFFINKNKERNNEKN